MCCYYNLSFYRWTCTLMVQSQATWCTQFITRRLRSSWCWISLRPKEQRPARSLIIPMDTELQNVYLSYSVLAQQGWPEFNSSVLSSDTPRDLPDPPVAEEPDRIICSQANEFLHQVKQLFTIVWGLNVIRDSISQFDFQLQTFEDLLNCRKLKPDEQRKVKSHITENEWSAI